MDITPLIPAGRQIVEGYGGGRFRISGAVHGGSVLVMPERTAPWPVARFEDLTLDSLEPVLSAAGGLDILLLGCGPRLSLVPEALRRAVRDRGAVIDAMDTGAACRTYNVLVSEGRRVAAALIAVD